MMQITGPLVVGLGEALFDCFPDNRVLGGAPLNVAIHANAVLRPQGGLATPATRVGVDALGDEVLATLQERGVAVDWVQRDPVRPTGRVDVQLDEDGDASYKFQPDSAWDALELTHQFEELAQRCDAVTFGTLAQRSEPSRQAIQGFLGKAKGALRLFDVNLRQDFYSAELLSESLHLATAVKVNQDELRILAGQYSGKSREESSLAANAEAIRSEYGLEWVAVTRGANGVAMATPEGWFEGETPSVTAAAEPNADTVGAGDACCAGLLTGALLEWPTEQTLRLANTLGAFVASRPGATPRLPEEIISMAFPGRQ
ncbi:carbohydrate kinase family protein [Botrimarina mediterranea]|uniref:2-dehydro-3-deoxygluconokinase n=1 Tax=Botrimarina mediterranea TaxID=2528022 RepID=A0A518KA84_9BACT|nr:carbohydrate kinase [Botrimarina mediterranea]QDV74701.1 2-dehydro-3-deoxygluconokinase [Botrimarina mediterranea]QDV79339.1 2-dehydro-3-deoxygluconokinase [Planctomycetes bacterium K2D]